MKTVQEVFNIALETHYGKSEFADSLYMCRTLKRLVEENLITPEEKASASEEIINLLAPSLSGAMVIFVCDENTTVSVEDFIPYGKRIYADWANKEAIIDSIREELKNPLTRLADKGGFTVHLRIGDPGSEQPKEGAYVISGNLNNMSDYDETQLKEEGHVLVYDDEYVVDPENDTLWLSNPQHWWWQPNYLQTKSGKFFTIEDDLELVLSEISFEAVEDFDPYEAVLPSTFSPPERLEELGYTKMNYWDFFREDPKEFTAFMDFQKQLWVKEL